MTNYGITSTSSFSPIYSLFHLNNTIISSKSHFPSLLTTNYTQLSLSYRSQSPTPFICYSSLGPGEGDSKTVLDAFFLGKALGEALTERVESVVGEVLSTVGRLQAEQQKQILEFQEDVLERAKAAKDKAAREALEAQGRLTPSATTKNADVTIAASSEAVIPRNGSLNSTAVVDTNGNESSEDEDSLSGIPIDE